MKKKLDMYLIYLIYIFELIYTMSAMYFNNSIVTHKIVFMDLVLYGFFIIPMLVSSPAMKMVCICFLIHLLICIKEKQLFVLEK